MDPIIGHEFVNVTGVRQGVTTWVVKVDNIVVVQPLVLFWSCRGERVLDKGAGKRMGVNRNIRIGILFRHLDQKLLDPFGFILPGFVPFHDQSVVENPILQALGPPNRHM